MSNQDRLVYHVVPDGDRWSLKQEGRERPTAQFDTQEAAVERGRREATKRGHSQLVVHGRDGRIKDERTYGDDPFPPAG